MTCDILNCDKKVVPHCTLMKRIHLILFLSVVLFLLPHIADCSEQDFLNTAERSWLRDHPTITIGPDPDFAPYEWLDSKGEYRGMSKDILLDISQKLGISFKVVKAENWSEILSMARRSEIDLLPAMAISPQRQEYLSFTSPWITMPGVIISAHDYQTVDALLGKKVAVVTNYIWDDFIANHQVNVKLVRCEDTLTALELTSLSGVDAMISDLATATKMIQQSGITNLRIVKRLDKKLELSFGVRKDWPELVTILDKTLATIDARKHNEIQQRWLNIIDIPWWRNSAFQRMALALGSGLLVFITSFIVWNRTLANHVQKRTAALRQAQQKLIHAAKMESIGQLATGVAHEVKNPLAIIRMGVEFLAESSARDDVEKDILKDMDDAVQRADTVIRGLLDFSSYKTLRLHQGDINEVVRQSLHLVGHEMRKRNIKVINNLDALPLIPIDFTKLQQVFINLFMNSAHAIGDNGQLQVATRMHCLSVADTDISQKINPGTEVIQITVRDTGPGISEEERDIIFDPFYTTKEVGEGTGLGLSVSRNIIEQHNGTLHLENHSNGGACATILLPCAERRTSEA